MAGVKKSAQGAQSAAQQAAAAGAGNDTATKEKPVSGPQNAVQDAPAAARQESAAEYTKFVYVGPSLPRGALNHNTVFDGTMQEITEYLSDVLKDYPQVKRLIVPVHRLGEASAKARTPGNILHKYYNDIVSAVSSRKKEG